MVEEDEETNNICDDDDEEAVTIENKVVDEIPLTVHQKAMREGAKLIADVASYVLAVKEDKSNPMFKLEDGDQPFFDLSKQLWRREVEYYEKRRTEMDVLKV